MPNLQYQARVDPLLPLAAAYLPGVSATFPDLPRKIGRVVEGATTSPLMPMPVWGAVAIFPDVLRASVRLQTEWVANPIVVLAAPISYWGDGAFGTQPTSKPRQAQSSTVLPLFAPPAAYWGDGAFGSQPTPKPRQVQSDTTLPLLAIASPVPYWGDGAYYPQPARRLQSIPTDNPTPVVIAAVAPNGVWNVEAIYPVVVRKPRYPETQTVLPLLPIVYTPFWGDIATYPIPSQVVRKGLSPSLLEGVFQPSSVVLTNGGIYYHIYWNHGTGGAVDFTAPIASTANLLFDAPPLFANADVTYLIRAYDLLTGYEEQNGDARVRIKLDGSGNDITLYPAPPIGLTAKAKVGGTASIRWQYPPGIGTKPGGFNVYVNNVFNQSVSALTALPTGTYSASISGLADGVTYTIGVSSFTSAGESSKTLITVIGAGVGPTAITGFNAVAIP